MQDWQVANCKNFAFLLAYKLYDSKKTYRKACKIFLDGPLPEPLFDTDAGARSLSNTTRTILHKNRRLSNIDKHTGATSTFEYGLSLIQQLRKRKLKGKSS